MRRILYITLSLLLLPFFIGINVLPAGAAQGMVSLTFDDGLASTWKHAFPILRQYQQKATVGIICSRLFMQDDDYMTTEQTLDLHRNGWEIVSHSLTHKRPSDIPLHYSDEQEIMPRLVRVERGGERSVAASEGKVQQIAKPLPHIAFEVFLPAQSLGVPEFKKGQALRLNVWAVSCFREHSMAFAGTPAQDITDYSVS